MVEDGQLSVQPRRQVEPAGQLDKGVSKDNPLAQFPVPDGLDRLLCDLLALEKT